MYLNLYLHVWSLELIYEYSKLITSHAASFCRLASHLHCKEGYSIDGIRGISGVLLHLYVGIISYSYHTPFFNRKYAVVE